MRRVLAAAIVLALTVPAVSMACAGWQATASARMECCLRAQDTGGDQLSADSCCAQAEQRRHQLLTAVPVLQLPVATVVAAPITALNHAHAAAAALERALLQYPQSPPFLSSILLI
jgi:hypothetical protein